MAGPNVNGTAYEMGTIRVVVEGQTYLAIGAISYEDPLEGGELRGTHPMAIGYTRGDLKPKASITLGKGQANYLRKVLAAKGAEQGLGYKEVRFDVIANYGGTVLSLITDEVIGCKVTNDKNSHTKGVDGLQEEWDLQPTKIIKDGVESILDSLY